MVSAYTVVYVALLVVDMAIKNPTKLKTIDWSKCEESYSTHLPLTIIEDPPLPAQCENRAKRSLPPGLVLKESGIPGAGQGIWAEKFFPKNVRFGPYEGESYNNAMHNHSAYVWEIECSKRIVSYIDAESERRSNWLRWVNTPMKHADENLIVVQHQGQKYYVTSKPIQPGTELLVYYGPAYAVKLGIDMAIYYSHSYKDVNWEECKEQYPTFPLTIVKDTSVPDECEDRAKQSLPSGLMVKESAPGAGQEEEEEGVWTGKLIPKDTRFGPFVGEIRDIKPEDGGRRVIYGHAWLIYCNGRPVYYMDAENERKSNWLRYIRYNPNRENTNLEVYQENGRIYYRTTKRIRSGRELYT